MATQFPETDLKDDHETARAIIRMEYKAKPYEIARYMRELEKYLERDRIERIAQFAREIRADKYARFDAVHFTNY